MIWCIKTYIIACVKTQKIRYIIHYVKPTAQLLFNSLHLSKMGKRANPNFKFLPEASFGLRVLSSAASVGLSIRVCVYRSRACPHDNSSLIQARITKFGPEMV